MTFKEALTMHVGLVNAVLVQCWYSYLNNAHTLTLPDGRTPILHRNRKRLFLGMDPDGYFSGLIALTNL